MDTNEKKVVLAFNRAINHADVETLTSLMSPDHVFMDTMGGKITGKETLARGWREFFRMFPDYRNTIEGWCQSGNTVMAHGHASGTYNGKKGLMPENRISMPAAWKAVIDGDKVKEWRVYADWTEGRSIIEKDKED